MSCKKLNQAGGSASACVVTPGKFERYMRTNCSGANLHNTDPSYTAGGLEMAQGKGFLPGLGGGSASNKMPRNNKKRAMTMESAYGLETPEQAGGSSCMTKSPEQSGGSSCMTKAKIPEQSGGSVKSPEQAGGGCYTNSKNPLTFGEYLRYASDVIRATGTGHLEQTGGGYSILPEVQFQGMAGRAKYDDCCPPAFIGGRGVMDPVGSTCGPLSQAGGSATVKYLKKFAKKHPKKSVTRKTRAKHTKKYRASEQRGGCGKMRPGAYPESLNGEPSDFNYMGKHLTYDGKQPFWGVSNR